MSPPPHDGCWSFAGLESQQAFFSGALNLRSKHDLLGALTSGNVKPDGSSYTASQFNAAVKAKLGVEPLLGCKGSTLTEVGLCFSKSDMSLIECDASVKSQRGEVTDCDKTAPIKFAPAGGGPAPSPPSPAGDTCRQLGCGRHIGAPCQCDSACEAHDDCCPDYKTTCAHPSPTPTPPSPSPSPTPPSTTSIRHGRRTELNSFSRGGGRATGMTGKP